MFLIALTSSAELIYQFEDQQQEDRFYRLINETRCPKCTSGSIASSNAPVSRDLKQKIYELILAGTSDEEIKNVSLVINQKNNEKITFHTRL